VNDILGEMHTLRHRNSLSEKHGNGPEKDGKSKPLKLTTNLALHLLCENIPLHSSSTALSDTIAAKLSRDEDRALELGTGKNEDVKINIWTDIE
jgi:hypothetical protein